VGIVFFELYLRISHTLTICRIPYIKIGSNSRKKMHAANNTTKVFVFHAQRCVQKLGKEIPL
jgi:hypothetical protein